MVDTPARKIWVMRGVYVALAAVILFCSLLPLETLPKTWAFPDVLLAITLAWALRRPEYVPSLAIAGVWLLMDLMLHRPPGVMAALVLMAAELLKPRAAQMRDEGFFSEIATIAILIALIATANRLILAIFLVPTPAFGMTLVQALATLAAYPLVVVLSNTLLGVRAKAPGDAATGGLRP